MTRIKKVKFLLEQGKRINYHFYYGLGMRRLIIDDIEDIHYNITNKHQVIAGAVIDRIYEEATKR